MPASSPHRKQSKSTPPANRYRRGEQTIPDHVPRGPNQSNFAPGRIAVDRPAGYHSPSQPTQVGMEATRPGLDACDQRSCQ